MPVRDALSVEELKNFSIFRNLPPEDVHRIGASVILKTYARSEIIVGYFDSGGDVFLLFDGQLLANRFSSAGREISYRRISAGSYFGELPAVDGQPRSVNIVALTEARVGRIPAGSFRELVENSKPFARALFADMAARIRELSNRLFEASAVSVRGRLDSELVRLALEVGVEDNRAVIVRGPTHAELAALIGGQRETVTRALAELVDIGLVTKRRRDLIIEDVQALIERVENAGA